MRSLFRTRRELALESLALRQQAAVLIRNELAELGIEFSR